MDLILIIAIGLLLWFWWDSSGVKEVATGSAKRLCDSAGVLFLDDSVALSKLYARRTRAGSVAIARRFTFEFCTDGEQRYAGYVDMLGKSVQQTYMQAYRIVERDEQ